MQAITVRAMRFDFGENPDPVVLHGWPEESFLLLGISLLLPYLEPYLIRSMKEAKGQLTDPALISDLDRFCLQEGQHYRQHVLFNKALRLRGYPGLEALEREIEGDYLRFTKEKPLRFNLAYAEGFEAMTTALALHMLEDRGKAAFTESSADLLFWHLIEELEHRTVAFEVYEAVVGDYPYRVGVSLFAQWHLIRFALRAATHMMEADRSWFEEHGGEEGAKERQRVGLRRLLTQFLPRVLRTYAPWYSPRDIEFNSEMRSFADHYSAVASRTR